MYRLPLINLHPRPCRSQYSGWGRKRRRRRGQRAGLPQWPGTHPEVERETEILKEDSFKTELFLYLSESLSVFTHRRDSTLFAWFSNYCSYLSVPLCLFLPTPCCASLLSKFAAFLIIFLPACLCVYEYIVYWLVLKSKKKNPIYIHILIIKNVICEATFKNKCNYKTVNHQNLISAIHVRFMFIYTDCSKKIKPGSQCCMKVGKQFWI